MIGNYIILYIYHITCAFWTLESSSGPMYKPRLPKRISSCQNIMTDPPALEAQAAIRNMAKEAADAPDQDKALREELEAEEAEKQMKKAKAKGRGKGKGKGKGKGGRGRGRGRGKKDDPEEQMPEVEVATTHDVDEVEVTKATDSPPVVEMEPPNDSLTPKSTGHKPIKRKRSKLRRLKALSPSSSAKKAAKCHAEPVAVPESQQDYQWGGTETDGDAWDGDWENWECPDAHVSGEWEKITRDRKNERARSPKETESEQNSLLRSRMMAILHHLLACRQTRMNQFQRQRRRIRQKRKARLKVKARKRKSQDQSMRRRSCKKNKKQRRRRTDTSPGGQS